MSFDATTLRYIVFLLTTFFTIYFFADPVIHVDLIYLCV